MHSCLTEGLTLHAAFAVRAAGNWYLNVTSRRNPVNTNMADFR